MNSDQRRSSPRSSVKTVAKGTPNLLKHALTKTLAANETPNSSTDNTAFGIEKAKNQFKLFKVLCYTYSFI